MVRRDYRDMYPYQLRLKNYIIEHPRCALFVDMGLGKTVATLSAIQYLILAGEVKKVLVVAPKAVAQSVWHREILIWNHTNMLTCSRCLGTDRQRATGLFNDTNIYVINRENVAWLVKFYLEGWGKWPFDMIVLDELSSFKSAKSIRFKMLKQKAAFISPRLVGLTGTPTSTSLVDLWSQIFLLDGGIRLGPTIRLFTNKFFFKDGYRTVPLPGAKEDITARIADICISMRSEDYLILPDLIKVEDSVVVSPLFQQAYKKFEAQAFMECYNDVGDNQYVNGNNLTQKLLQFTSGAVYSHIEDEAGSVSKRITYAIHTAKDDMLAEIVEAATSPLLVFYQFQHERDRLLEKFKHLPAELYKGPETANRWCRGEIPMLIVHPETVGHGLNLQDGGNIIVWMTLPWSLEYYQQANKRLHRQGQKKSVIVRHLIMEGTKDAVVLEALKKNVAVQDYVFEATKAELSHLVPKGMN